MPDLTTKDALLEKIVEETGKLVTNVPAALENYLPLTGGTLTGNITIADNAPSLDQKRTDFTKGTAVSATTDLGGITTRDKNNTVYGYMRNVVYSSGDSVIMLRTYKNDSSSNYAQVVVEYPNSGNHNFRPNLNNQMDLGQSNALWKQVYAGTATISTSDERLKDNIKPISDDVLDAWGEVGWYQYQFKDALEGKGKKARIHTGAIAQRIQEVFEKHKLDAFSYGLLCYDEWDAEEEQKDEDGNVVQEAREAGNLYSLRYEEALCLEAAYQRRRADRIEARLEALESKFTRKKK